MICKLPHAWTDVKPTELKTMASKVRLKRAMFFPRVVYTNVIVVGR